jgi:phage-related baseplate assembly protein
VVSAKAIDLDDAMLDPGFVNLYIADASGTASSDLIDAVDLELNNWRPAGVLVTTAAPSIVPVNVTAVLTVDPGFNSTDVVEAVNARLTDFIGSLEMGDDVFLALIYQQIIDTNPVAILNAQVSAPSADTSIDASEIARPGTFTVSVV